MWLFDIPWLDHFNLSLSIISCLCSGDTCFSLGISLSCIFVTVSDLFYCEFFETFVILLEVLLPINSPVASAVFWRTLFEEVLSASVAGCLAWSSSLEYCSVNHTSINVNSELKVFKNIKFLVKYLVTDQMTYWEETYTRLLNLDDNCC